MTARVGILAPERTQAGWRGHLYHNRMWAVQNNGSRWMAAPAVLKTFSGRTI
jgi:hypothetical protein